ncbi:MAG: HYR domain-containing protein [Chloroflexota bacterium]
MFRRPLRRAAVLSLGVLLAFAGTAAADSVLADADTVTPVIEGSRFLGDVAPGATVAADVRFLVTCVGIQHVDANQSVVLTGAASTAPLDGAVVSVSTATLAPLTTPWPADAVGCPDPTPTQEGGAFSHVVLRAPTTAGMQTFTIMWSRSVDPVGSNDGNATGRTATTVSFSMRVVSNTPPTLTVPTSFTVEADTQGGWTSSWTVWAADAEDDPDPTPTCSPAAGSLLPLGVTTVTCSVADAAGATIDRDFDVTVVDTTAPAIRGVPSDMAVTTGDANGRTVTFASPTASDIVDASPNTGCAPESGSIFPVGTTNVTCTSSDASGNASNGTFRVTVRYVAPREGRAVWLEPVASANSTFVANRGRTVPVKVQLFVNRVAATAGDARLQLTPCEGGTSTELPLAWSGGRWNVAVDTSSLAASCYTVTATIDGLAAGSFTLELRDGDAAAKALPKKTALTPPATTSNDRRSKTNTRSR